MKKIFIVLNLYILYSISFYGQNHIVPIDLESCAGSSFSFEQNNEWYKLLLITNDSVASVWGCRLNIIDSNSVLSYSTMYADTKNKICCKTKNYVKTSREWSTPKELTLKIKDTIIKFGEYDFSLQLLKIDYNDNVGSYVDIFLPYGSHLLLRQTDSSLILADPKDIVTTKRGLYLFKYNTLSSNNAINLLCKSAEIISNPNHNMRTKSCSADTLNYDIQEWVKKNISFPAQYQGEILSGRMIVKLSFNKKGFVRDIKIVNPLDDSLNDYVIEKLKTMPSVKEFEFTSKDVRIGGQAHLRKLKKEEINYNDLDVNLKEPVEIFLNSCSKFSGDFRLSAQISKENIIKYGTNRFEKK